ncbi:hypothetical protein KP509_03G031300 [Ceratopteris richardii]|uniref:Uncharacterized protein n=1 Tax=Ceratopteris richardii TaxID=49495 RepID=A0A8T2V5X4_CERRI|nr:hypothetical protein KP509_03G031300 [Ceratopteris richardii]
MTVDASFSSLPFAPLPHVRDNNLRRCSPKLFRGVEGGGVRWNDKCYKENIICSTAAPEELKCSTLDDRLEDHRKEDARPLSWSKLGSRLLPFTIQGEAIPLYARGTTTEDTGTHQWSALYCSFRPDGVAGMPPVQTVYELNTTATVQSAPSSKQKQDDAKKQEFHVNVGFAIRTLREELPYMFYKDLSYDIYREDIVFRDPANVVAGINNYKLIYKALRFHGGLFFKALWVDVLRIWQPSDNVIMVRWQVRGIPRVPWEAQGVFDGTSEYMLDKSGKIYEHKVDNVALHAKPKFKVLSIDELLHVGTCPSSPKPTFYEKVQVVFTAILPYFMQFTWIRYYLALKGTVQLYQCSQLL